MSRDPGIPRLLRRLNDRAALELLLGDGPLTRAELGERTGLSKVTAGQLLSRLEERGLVEVAGERAGGRGPHAALYAVVPSSAYVAGLEVLPDILRVGVADITGRVVVEITLNPSDGADLVKAVPAALRRACEAADVSLSRLRSFVIGTRGVVDPASGDVRWSYDLPAWHVGVLAGLRDTIDVPVTIENDVNLVALAEHRHGAAVGHDDFVVLWAGIGQGMGVMLGGRLHRGITGGAGEIGWLPVPGEPLPADVSQPQSGSFQRLVGHDALRGLAEEHGVAGKTVPDLVRGGHEDYLDAVAARLAVGAAAVTVVLDPGLIVLSGEIGRAGGDRLAAKVQEAVARVCPSRPTVVATRVTGNPVLRGALVAALDQAREEVFSDTV
ncbi:ROK family transcriptional regulator [Nonomuraea jiangxiensis]|uniref:Sugar kinase of the NBD/HSP70 family, may contain an N-terminal HTH domain n=1 Tax=Nonomuraea jiangxiensis TaxID=633440 RepID=A0A1G7Y7D9_9ACTN|nr:ROK family transcriptional regulator [Nonomuraea jiangxiensis]SDG92415.1 Sugar kinase of the NBD/HSP70 family, may contain an N-terminal HTH domain [Nonomuraea jiangxiensis]